MPEFDSSTDDYDENINYGDAKDETIPKIGVQMDLAQSEGHVQKTLLEIGEGKAIGSSRAVVRLLYSAQDADSCCESEFEGFSDYNKPLSVELWKDEESDFPRGFTMALRSMKKKEKAAFLVSPKYAYGDKGYKSLPSGHRVKYEIEIVSWAPIEDVSKERDNSVIKQQIEEGDTTSYYTPEYETLVTVDILGHKGKDKVMDKQNISIQIGNEELSDNLERAISRMKKGERSEVTISDVTGPVEVYEIKLHNFKRVDPWAAKGPEKTEEARQRKDDGNKLWREKQTCESSTEI